MMKAKAKSYIALLRPQQWLKNLLLFFPPFFAGKILDSAVLDAMVPSFLSFSLAASCAYIVNDIRDRECDSRHVSKKYRPVANGDISLPVAGLIAATLYVVSMVIAGSISRKFEALVILYLFISFAYTFYFKHVVILDIFIIALGFLVRVLAGGEAFNLAVTNWLFLCVFIVALFLAAGKRLAELITLGEFAHTHRRSLAAYTPSFLEGVLWFSAASALVTYALYTIENANRMFYTTPLAAFGLIRYIYLVKEGKGDPTQVLLKDWQVMVTGILWAGLIAIMIYQT